jgi:hypothetical protein
MAVLFNGGVCEGKGNFRAKVSKAWLVWSMHGEGKGTFLPKVSKALLV